MPFRMGIRNKLFAGFGAVILLAVAGFAANEVIASQLKAEVSELADFHVPVATAARSAMTSLMTIDDLGAWYVLTTDPKQAEERLSLYRTEVETLRGHLAFVYDRTDTPKERVNLDALREFLDGKDGYFAGNETAFAMKAAGRIEEARQAYVSVPFEPGIKHMQDFIASEQAQIDEIRPLIRAQQTQATVIALSVIALTLAAGIGIAFFISRQIATGVNKMSRAASGIAQGDVRQDVTVTSRDEIGDMAQAFERMIAYLGEMAGAANEIARGNLTVTVTPKSDADALGHAFVTMVDGLNDTLARTTETAEHLNEARLQLQQAADQAALATQEVARASQQVAEGTTAQADGTQRINAGVVDLTAGITQVERGAQTQAHAVAEATALSARVAGAAEQMAAGALAAADGARSAAATADEGATLVQRTVDGMHRIQETVANAANEVASLGERSREIGKIVNVIQDIAAQTNLLALNAAIEAARAGEQGRGFAVVADEVRQLAERVAGATREIGDLIDGVQRDVDASVRAMQEGATEVGNGTAAAGEAGASLQRILAAATAVSEQIAQVADGSQELRTSGSEMAALVAEIREVVEQNAGATSQMRTAVEEAADQVTSIAAVAEENSAATEQLSASAEEMTAQVEELTASTHELGAMAQDLRDQVAAFTLRGRAAAVVDLQAARGARAA